MKKPIAILGIGQFGGNIADIAEQFGFTTGAMNLCKEDLKSLKYVQSKLHLGRSFGAGKNRSEAIEVIKENYEDVAEWIKKIYNDEDIKIVYVSFSTGGGSGSGIGPLIIDLMSDIMPEKKWGAITALPFEDEGISVNANTISCIEELTSVENLATTFVIDNNKVYSRIRTSIKDVFDYTNKKMMAHLDSFINYTTYSSKLGNLDMNDFLKILSVRGNAVMNSIIIPDNFELTEDSLSKLIESEINNSIFADIEFDRNIIRAGMIYELSDNQIKYINNGKIFKNIGKPFDLYQGFYNTNKGIISPILSGLSFPNSTLEKIDISVFKEEQQMQERLSNSKQQSFKSKSSKLIGLLQETKKNDFNSQKDKLSSVERSSTTLKDKLSKYK